MSSDLISQAESISNIEILRALFITDTHTTVGDVAVPSAEPGVEHDQISPGESDEEIEENISDQNNSSSQKRLQNAQFEALLVLFGNNPASFTANQHPDLLGGLKILQTRTSIGCH